MKLILRIIINAVAILIASWLLKDRMVLSGGWWGLLVVALIFGVVNALIRPIVALFSLPITFLTLGLFSLVINAAMLLLTAWIAQQYLTFSGSFLSELWWAIIASIIISIVSIVVNWLLPD